MIYEKYCPICKQRTLQKVIKVSRKRGLKLMCLKCGRESTRYIKLHYLNLAKAGGK